MSNESQDKKDTVPDVPSAKSLLSEGLTTEFGPGSPPVGAIAPELLPPMSTAELPQLEPEYLQDIAQPNPNDVALPASTPAATTQPSLRRLQRALQSEPEPARRGRGVQALLVVLGLAIVWEVALLARTSLNARESRFTPDGQPGPSASVMVSGARPNTGETSEQAAQLPAPMSAQAPTETLPPAAEPTNEPTAASNSSAQASAPRAPALLQDLEPSLRPEPSVRPKPASAETPQPTSSAKSPSKVLFPPQ
jgi:hypothetical protein